MYDAGNAVTKTESQAKKYVYTVTVLRRDSVSSFNYYKITPSGLSSTVTVVPPYQGGIPSSKPLAGSFIIKCPDPNGKVFQTRPQAVSAKVESIQSDFEEDISWLRGKVRVQRSYDGNLENAYMFNHPENGVNLFLIFDGLNFNPPQCTLDSDINNPLTGDTPKFVAVTQRPYGTSLMFEPIGLEFLYTDAKNPQVLVNVDGLPALCVNMNCDYAYVQAVSQVTSQTYDSASRLLTVTGSALPTSDLQVSFGGVGCAASPAPIFTLNQIQCTLVSKPRAGSHKAEIRSSSGLLPYAANVPAIDVTLIANSVSPTSVNPLGGATITINGAGFPQSTDLMKVELSDGTSCRILTLTEVQVSC